MGDQVRQLKFTFKLAAAFTPVPPLGLLAFTRGRGVISSILDHFEVEILVAVVVVVVLIVAGIVLIVRELRHPSWGALGIRMAAPEPEIVTGVVVQCEPVTCMHGVPAPCGLCGPAHPALSAREPLLAIEMGVQQ